MDIAIKRRVEKRKSDIYDFYYRSFGDKIKRTRTKLKITQETLSKGICSNTFISKLENNKIPVKRDCLFLIMEKMGIANESILYPEKMVDSLDKALEFFFYKDLDSYEDLFKDIEKYDYGILLSIIKLGYYILIEDYSNATYAHDDMYRYINALEDYGFSVFIVFSCYYYIGIGDYKSAKGLLDSTDNNLRNNDMLFGLFHNAKFIIYGYLHQFSQSASNLAVAQNRFFAMNNPRRINESIVYHNIFRLYEKNRNGVNFHLLQLKTITDELRNYYLIMLAYNTENPNKYLKHLVSSNQYFLAGLFLLGVYYLEKDDQEAYKSIKNKINKHHYEFESTIDFGNLLKLIESKDILYLKSYLIDYMIPRTIESQDIFFHKEITRVISEILISKKRYKDAISYERKSKEFARYLNQGI